MNNAQRSAARKAERRYPNATFRAVEGGVEVNGVLVPVGASLTLDEVFKALAGAANG